jgi:hypothetical protein
LSDLLAHARWRLVFLASPGLVGAKPSHPELCEAGRQAHRK